MLDMRRRAAGPVAPDLQPHASAPTASSTSTWATASTPPRRQNLDSFRGKILRMNLDGTAPDRQPVLQRRRRHQRHATTSSPTASATRSAAPGGRPTAPTTTSRTARSIDRFAQVVRGPQLRLGRHRREHDATSRSTTGNPAHAPVNIAFVQPRDLRRQRLPRRRRWTTPSSPSPARPTPPARRPAASGSSSSRLDADGELRRHAADAAGRVHRHRQGDRRRPRRRPGRPVLHRPLQGQQPAAARPIPGPSCSGSGNAPAGGRRCGSSVRPQGREAALQAQVREQEEAAQEVHPQGPEKGGGLGRIQ